MNNRSTKCHGYQCDTIYIFQTLPKILIQPTPSNSLPWGMQQSCLILVCHFSLKALWTSFGLFLKTILNTLTLTCCLHRKIVNENMIKRAFNLVLDGEWMCHLNRKRTSAVSSLMNFVLWGSFCRMCWFGQILAFLVLSTFTHLCISLCAWNVLQ